MKHFIFVYDAPKLELINKFDIQILIKILEKFDMLEFLPTNNSILNNKENIKKKATNYNRMQIHPELLVDRMARIYKISLDEEENLKQM